MADEQLIFYHTQKDTSYKGTAKQIVEAIKRTWPNCDHVWEDDSNLTARDSKGDCLIELYVTPADAPSIPERFDD